MNRKLEDFEQKLCIFLPLLGLVLVYLFSHLVLPQKLSPLSYGIFIAIALPFVANAFSAKARDYILNTYVIGTGAMSIAYMAIQLCTK